MLTPEYLDTLPDTLVSLWQRVEDDILRDIARRIGKMDTVTETAAWQLWRLEQTRALRTDIVRLLAKYSGKSDTEIRRLLQEAGTRTLASDDALYQAMGLDPPNVNTSPALLNLLNAGYRQTRGTWQNFTRTTANTVTRQFENALDRAWLQVSSGAFDYKTAIKRAVDGLSQDMKYITYPTGHRDTLEVAVRRAVLTGVNQTACKLQIARADEMGCEFVEVSAHSARAVMAAAALVTTPGGKAKYIIAAALLNTTGNATRALKTPPATARAKGCAVGTAGTTSTHSGRAFQCPIIRRSVWLN